ncbi:MAG: cupin-like domain-containing protein [Thiotrichaceae bacterium]|nr:cupin-like domain-containing protein [Thiotrichaceae bacterium]
MLNNFFTDNQCKELKESIENRQVKKITLNKETVSFLFSIEKLNNYLNNSLLIDPYVSVNNFNSTTSKRDLIERTTNKYSNALENELSLKNILFRIAKGDTLVVNKLQIFDQEIRDLADNLSELFLADTNVNLYYAHNKTTGINLHFDYKDVLAIQTHGTKHWKIYNKEKAYTNETIDKQKKPDIDNKKDFIDITTTAGDLLFIPKGVWHYAFTEQNSSIHLSLSLNPIKLKEVIAEIIDNNFPEIGEKPLYNFTKKSLQKNIDHLCKLIKETKIDNDLLSCIERKAIKTKYKIELE